VAARIGLELERSLVELAGWSGVDVFANGVGFGTQGCFVVKEINRKSFFLSPMMVCDGNLSD